MLAKVTNFFVPSDEIIYFSGQQMNYISNINANQSKYGSTIKAARFNLLILYWIDVLFMRMYIKTSLMLQVESPYECLCLTVVVSTLDNPTLSRDINTRWSRNRSLQWIYVIGTFLSPLKHQWIDNNKEIASLRWQNGNNCSTPAYVSPPEAASVKPSPETRPFCKHDMKIFCR